MGAALVAALAGCTASDRTGALPVRTLFTDLQCSAAAPGVRRVTDSAQWDALRRELARTRIGAPQTAVPDFARESVLVIDMGRRASLGYSVGLAEREARLRDGWLELRVVWQEPVPGTVQGTMVTSPCAVLAIPAGVDAPVRVLDARGEERARERSP